MQYELQRCPNCPWEPGGFPQGGGCLGQGELQKQDREKGIVFLEHGSARVSLEELSGVEVFLRSLLAVKQPLQSPLLSGADFPFVCLSPSGCTWLPVC